MTADRELAAGPEGGAAIERELRTLLEKRLGTAVTPDHDLFASGLISSLFAMELVVQLEQKFEISIVGKDLRMDNFRSVTAMTGLVHRLRQAAYADGV